jgi:hypothetical protein
MMDLFGIRALVRETGAASLTGALRFVDIMIDVKLFEAAQRY